MPPEKNYSKEPVATFTLPTGVNMTSDDAETFREEIQGILKKWRITNHQVDVRQEGQSLLVRELQTV